MTISQLEFPPREQWMVWGLFLRAYKVVTDQVDKALKAEAPISLPEFEILHILTNNNGRMRLIDLATGTLLSQSRISRQVDALQAKGLLVREISEADRRATYAVLTPEGVQTYDAARQPFLKAYYATYAVLTPEGVQTYDAARQPFLKAYYKHFSDLIGDQSQAFGTVLNALMTQEKLPSGMALFIDAMRAANVQPQPPAPARAANATREYRADRYPVEGFAS